jgi:TRAP-type C4-dicarboxylate transport system substrate-binding protein
MRNNDTKMLFACLVGAMVLGFAVAGNAAEKVTPSVKLTFSTEYNENDMRGEVGAYWADLVEKRTNGKVKVETHYSGEIISGKDAFAGTATGAIDVSLLSSSYFTGDVPAVELFILPLPPPTVTLAAFSDAWKDNRNFFSAKIEKKGCKPLLAFPMGTFTIVASRKPIRTAEDFKGMKVRVAGGKVLPASVRAFGAGTATIAAAEVYPALQNGTVDAVITMDETYIANSFYEVAPYVTECRWYTGNYFILINPEVYAKLTPDLQKVITECSHETEIWGEKHSYAAADIARTKAKAKAKEYYVLPEKEAQKWSEMVQPVWTNWAKAQGADGQMLLDMLLKKKN